MHYIYFLIFLLLRSHYVADLIKKLKLHLTVVLVLLKMCPKSVYRYRKQPVSTPDKCFSNLGSTC